jgi:hypothetical protein
MAGACAMINEAAVSLTASPRSRRYRPRAGQRLRPAHGAGRVLAAAMQRRLRRARHARVRDRPWFQTRQCQAVLDRSLHRGKQIFRLRARANHRAGVTMTRIAIIVAATNAEQARCLRRSETSERHRRRSMHAYIRLPKLFEACQGLGASLSAGPLSRGAADREPCRRPALERAISLVRWCALALGRHRRAVIDAINARKTRALCARASLLRGGARAARQQGPNDQTYTAAEGLGLEASWRWSRLPAAFP